MLGGAYPGRAAPLPLSLAESAFQAELALNSTACDVPSSAESMEPHSLYVDRCDSPPVGINTSEEEQLSFDNSPTPSPPRASPPAPRARATFPAPPGHAHAAPGPAGRAPMQLSAGAGAGAYAHASTVAHVDVDPDTALIAAQIAYAHANAHAAALPPGAPKGLGGRGPAHADVHAQQAAYAYASAPPSGLQPNARGLTHASAHASAPPSGLHAGMGAGGPSSGMMMMQPPPPPPLSLPVLGRAPGAGSMHRMDVPPPGCSADAIKLFVGGIPKCYTEGQLMPFFQVIGNVIDLVVVRDPVTRKSKGSAFVWYGSRAESEAAVQYFNLNHVMPNPKGNRKKQRPLVVREAAASGYAPPSQPLPMRAPGPLGVGTTHLTHPLSAATAYATALAAGAQRDGDYAPSYLQAGGPPSYLHAGPPSYMHGGAGAPPSALAYAAAAAAGAPRDGEFPPSHLQGSGPLSHAMQGGGASSYVQGGPRSHPQSGPLSLQHNGSPGHPQSGPPSLPHNGPQSGPPSLLYNGPPSHPQSGPPSRMHSGPLSHAQPGPPSHPHSATPSRMHSGPLLQQSGGPPSYLHAGGPPSYLAAGAPPSYLQTGPPSHQVGPPSHLQTGPPSYLQSGPPSWPLSQQSSGPPSGLQTGTPTSPFSTASPGILHRGGLVLSTSEGRPTMPSMSALYEDRSFTEGSYQAATGSNAGPLMYAMAPAAERRQSYTEQIGSPATDHPSAPYPAAGYADSGPTAGFMAGDPSNWDSVAGGDRLREMVGAYAKQTSFDRHSSINSTQSMMSMDHRRCVCVCVSDAPPPPRLRATLEASSNHKSMVSVDHHSPQISGPASMEARAGLDSFLGHPASISQRGTPPQSREQSEQQLHYDKRRHSWGADAPQPLAQPSSSTHHLVAAAAKPRSGGHIPLTNAQVSAQTNGTFDPHTTQSAPLLPLPALPLPQMNAISTNGGAGAGAPSALAAAADSEVTTTTVPVTTAQLPSVAEHMHNIQLLSGCTLSVLASGPNQFYIVVTGTSAQDPNVTVAHVLPLDGNDTPLPPLPEPRGIAVEHC
ncbi:hypothetical protein FOA52_010122 [Chlamydomonas sp. UWO 241]|nr:hypothetical protein FOA52_010122 [Chlamydomonas sp. UWO 241]